LHDNRANWKKCKYIAPKNRPSRWKGKQETFNKINKVLKTWEEGKVKWFVNRFRYDGLKESTTIEKDSKPTSDTTKEGDSRKLGSFATHSSFTSSQEDYKLYNAWTLDNASDTHVCNDIQRSGFRQTREARPDDELFARKTAYPIEAFGTITIHA
jgi:hypothetical protein